MTVIFRLLVTSLSTMAPTGDFPSITQLIDNDTALFEGAADVLLRIMRNILAEPSNPKYRSIPTGSSVFKNKLLPANGAVGCLFEMGFVEGQDNLNLPADAPLDKIRLIQKQLISAKENRHKPTPSTSTNKATPPVAAPPIPPVLAPPIPPIAAPPTPPVVAPPIPPVVAMTTPSVVAPPVAATPTQIPPTLAPFTKNPFFARLIAFNESVLQYENADLMTTVLYQVPMRRLNDSAIAARRKAQLDGLKSKLDPPLDYQEMLLMALISWFKTEYFEWVDVPPCPSCKDSKVVPSRKPAPRIVGADRVEMYECTKCNGNVMFPRYNDVSKLLETRRGRCGEWANCFTFICRSLGWDARLVLDETDHVWTEVYIGVLRRWVHCDPCEGVIDCPLMYEAGWNKKLSYVTAHSFEEIQDVTWRYSSNHAQLLKRRNKCSESALVDFINAMRQHRCKKLSPPRRQFILKRCVEELAQMLVERKPTPSALQGRQSGALAWRQSRGEIQDGGHVWKVTAADTEDGVFSLGYLVAKDEYVAKPAVKSGWSTGMSSCTNIQRKVEKDWKMVYIARCDGSIPGRAEWTVELESQVIDRIDLRFERTVFSSGKITVALACDDISISLEPAQNEISTDAFKGKQSVKVTAVLEGGEGDIAWQHTQLFRQSSSDLDSVPFLLKISVSQ